MATFSINQTYLQYSQEMSLINKLDVIAKWMWIKFISNRVDIYKYVKVFPLFIDMKRFLQ